MTARFWVTGKSQTLVFPANVTRAWFQRKPNARGSSESQKLVIPAKAGIQLFRDLKRELDPSLRWDDGSVLGDGEIPNARLSSDSHTRVVPAKAKSSSFQRRLESSSFVI
jgi:hypothetical protein